jgi:hypothetical protein
MCTKFELKYMTEYNLYLKYSYKKIKQFSDSSLEFNLWWLDKSFIFKIYIYIYIYIYIK